MSLETKIEILKYILLHQSYDFDMALYGLIAHKRLNEEISRIDDKSFNFNFNAEADGITSMQFLINMNEFVKCMKEYFFNIRALPTCIDYILSGSKQELSSLLSYKCKRVYSYFGERADDTTEELISKLIISNFIHNAKYVDSIRDVLTDIEVPLKPLEDYTLAESKKILKLLSDMAFCQRGRGDIFCLFTSIDDQLEKRLKMSKSFQRRKPISDVKQQEFIESVIADYNKVIKSYYSKKKYLKYFI